MTATVRPLRLALALGLAAIGGCTAEPISPYMPIDQLITTVTARNGTVIATLRDGSPPAPESGPAASVAGISTVVNGGSAQVAVSSGQTFLRAYISVTTATGYWDLLLPDGVTLEDLIVSVSSAIQSGQMRVRYTLEGPTGVGQYAEQTLKIIHVGTGDIQISVAWTNPTDVDLHVIDPSNEEIYWAHKTSASGGTLDLDSNPACYIDNKNNENIVWPAGRAPHGTYRVVVHYYADCNQPRSDWVVTVLVKGQSPQTFTGSFVGAYSGNPPAQVVSFDY
jgi:hypothetical protein